MKQLLFLFAAMVSGLVASACVAGGSDMFAQGNWRYKMTVEVETPDGLKTGYAVREVFAVRGWQPLPESGATLRVKGEAVAIDLGERGFLFALLRGGKYGVDHAKSVVFDAFPSEDPPLSAEGIKYYSTLRKSETVMLKPDLYPMFVYLENMADPKTVKALSATNAEDIPYGYSGETIYTFESIFGKGVKLKSVKIEMTDEDVTWRAAYLLPWLDVLNGRYLHQKMSSRGSPYGLQGGNFRTGAE